MSRHRIYAATAIVAALSVAPLACSAAGNIPGQVPDLAAVVSCVEQHWGQPFASVVTACDASEESVVADVIADILSVVGLRSADGGVGAASNPYANDPSVKAAFARRAASGAR